MIKMSQEKKLYIMLVLMVTMTVIISAITFVAAE